MSRAPGFRPAIDPLFRTAAREFGSRVVGVVLSGALGDGTYGLSVIKQHGGIAIVQEPGDAIIPAMPANAIKLRRRRPRAAGAGHRALWEVREGRVVRYQCHVGHQYAPENLEEGQRAVIDGALWSAVRVLEEHAALKTRMAERAAEGGLTVVSQGFADGARAAHEQAQRIRAVLFDLGHGGNGGDDGGAQPQGARRATAARKKPLERRRTSRRDRTQRRGSRR